MLVQTSYMSADLTFYLVSLKLNTQVLVISLFTPMIIRILILQRTMYIQSILTARYGWGAWTLLALKHARTKPPRPRLHLQAPWGRSLLSHRCLQPWSWQRFDRHCVCLMWSQSQTAKVIPDWMRCAYGFVHERIIDAEHSVSRWWSRLNDDSLPPSFKTFCKYHVVINESIYIKKNMKKY